MLFRLNIPFIKRKIRVVYKNNFSFFALLLPTVLLILGLFVLDKSAVFATLISVCLLIVIFIYYYQYFKRFKGLEDVYSEDSNYYFEVYEFWAIILFSTLFLFTFSFVGVVIGSYSFFSGLNNLAFYDLLFLLIGKVADSFTLGFFSTYELVFSNITVQTFFGKTYIYITTLIVELAVVASFLETLIEKLKVRNAINRAFKIGRFDHHFKNTVSPRMLGEILKHINSGKLDVKLIEEDIVGMVMNSSSKQAKNLVLQLYQETNNQVVVSSCEDFFSKNYDKRFSRIKKV